MFGDRETLTFTDEARDVIITALREQAEDLARYTAREWDEAGNTEAGNQIRNRAASLNGYAALIEGNILTVARAA